MSPLIRSAHFCRVILVALVVGWWTGPMAGAAEAQSLNTGGGTPDPGSTLSEARDELASGRFWHAAELLLEIRERTPLPDEGLLLLARAEAGYRNWAGVVEVLDGAAWAEALAPVEAPYLLGRAAEAGGRWGEAARLYGIARDRSPSPSLPVQAHLARALLRTGDVEGAISVLRGMDVPGAGSILSALAWEMASWSAGDADSTAVGGLLLFVRNSGLLERAADFYPRAVLAQGDSARAESLYRELLAENLGGRGEVWRERVATLALARGDTAEARPLFRTTLMQSGATGAGMRSAQQLVRIGGLDREEALAAARALDRLGDGGRALAAYDAYVELSLEAGLEAEAGARVERARLAATIPSRVAEAVEEFRALDEHPDPAVGARALDVWADLRRRQGQTDNLRTLRQWLVERYPDTDQAAEVVYLRGDFAQDLEDWEGAMSRYREVAAMAPSRSLAGAARMRLGQILAHTGDLDGALTTFSGYLEDFPEGRRWAEASFWAGWVLAAKEDTAAAVPFLERVLRDDPFSYYAVEAAQLLGRPYPGVVAPAPVLSEPEWVGTGLERLDLMQEAGLEASLAIHVQALVSRAEAEGIEARYTLAEGLIQRGWTIEGINLGWALVRGGEEWNQRLLRIVYPFPNREMVEREAAELGLDPILMAGLIRQESAWDSDIVSSAGAIGLMQVMPSTGRQLAQAEGPSGFTPESLETAEVNLHLGGRFLRDMLDRFGPELPLVLSAYNAGPTRAVRWRGLPEAGDRLRLTERIPFNETRGYVKNVTRNLALYRALYGARTANSTTQ